MWAMTLRLRLTIAFVLGLLVVVPNAGAAPYPPTLALHPTFTSASIGADGSILVNLEEEYASSPARHSTTSRYLADGQLDRSFEPERPGGMEVAEATDSKGRTLRRSARGGVERLNPDGSIETSFAPPGRGSPGSWSDEFRIETILPLASGKVAVAGQVRRGNGQAERYEVRVALYEESGLIDSGFGTEGIVRLTEEIGIEAEEFVGLTSGPAEDLLVSFNEKRWGTPTSMAGTGSRVVALNLKGTLDPGFASGGVHSSPDPIAAVEGMPNGALLLAGTRWGAALSRSGQTHHSDVYLERLTPLGAPDPAFGEQQGRTAVDLGGIDAVHALLLRPDGSALVGGGTTSLSPRCLIYESTFCTETPVLSAFTASGGLDRSFGRDGVLRLRSLAYEFALFNRFKFVEPLGVLFLRGLPDGRVLAGGGTEVDAFLAELGGDGRLESGFGDGGTVTRTNPRRSTTELGSMAVDRRGRIVVSGETDAGIGEFSFSGAVFRFRADGAVDRGFAGGQGYVRVPEPPMPPEPLQAPTSISLDAHGRTLALGADFASQRATVTRIGTNGRPDRRFGIDGIAPLPRYAWVEVGARKVRLRLNLLARLVTALPDGGSLVYARAGYDHGRKLYPALIRLTSHGRLDRSFGHRGVAVIAGGAGGSFEASVMAALAGGKILLGGAVRSPCGSGYRGRSAALMRLGSDGSLDPSFSHGGLTTVPSCRWGRAFASMALGPGGEIFTAGGTWTKWKKTGPHTITVENLPVIARFSARGRLDPGFGRRAIRTLRSPGSLPPAERVILWRDRILVAGEGASGAFAYSRNGRFEHRLTPGGRSKPIAGHTLGMAVQDGKPVTVITTEAERDLTVQPLMRP
jgi:uncharacterized delta-60 repeat protein